MEAISARIEMNASSSGKRIKAGKANFEGDRKPFDQLRGLMVTFAPNSRSCRARLPNPRRLA
jgi:hypothetical protein